jgi:hypothetical protein
LRGEVQREAAVVSRRGLETFEECVRRRAQQVADDFDSALAKRLAVPGPTPLPPVQIYLPPPRRAVLEDRLSAVFGTGFGLGVALTLGRFVAEAMPAAVPAVVPLCGGAGVALAGWVVRTRRLVTARAALERWAGEVASGLRAALEERVLVAESALLEAHTANPTPAEQADAAVADPTVEAWMGELARVRAELDEGVPRIVGG